VAKREPTEGMFKKQVREETFRKLQGKSKKGKELKYRREFKERSAPSNRQEKDLNSKSWIIKFKKLPNFVLLLNEVATMMDVPTTRFFGGVVFRES